MIENTRSGSNWKGLCRKSESGKEYLSSKIIRFELSNIFSKLLTDVLYLQHYHFTGISLENLVLQNRGSVSTDFPKDSDSSSF